MKREEIFPIPGGWLNLVVDEPNHPKDTIIFCHGLTGDRTGPQKILAYLAQGLSQIGLRVIRFDFRGSGDSSGRFEETTFSQMCSDLEKVAHWSDCPSPILAGISIGAVPAVLSAKKLHCKALFLLSSDLLDQPDFSLSQDPNPIRKGQFFLNKNYYSERGKLCPRKSLSQLNIPASLFYGAEDEKMVFAAKEMEKIATTYCIPQTGHLFESLDARELLLTKIIEFYDESRLAYSLSHRQK